MFGYVLGAVLDGKEPFALCSNARPSSINRLRSSAVFVDFSLERAALASSPRLRSIPRSVDAGTGRLDGTAWSPVMLDFLTPASF